MKRPNVILILSDQQRFDSLGCYGSGFVNTPAIDGLAADGMRFDRAYCTNPVCAPSRASIFTGNCVDRHGVFNCGINFEDSEGLLTHRLARLGYATRHIGKAHFGVWNGECASSLENYRHYPKFTGPFYGFETIEIAQGHTSYGLAGHYGVWAREELAKIGIDKVEITPMTEPDFGGRAYRWNIPPRLSNSAWTADRAVEFIKNKSGGEPFFLNVGFQDPHHPHILHAEKADTLDPDKIPLPHYVSVELDDKPPFFGRARAGGLEGSEFRGRFAVAGQIPGVDVSRIPDEHARLGRAYYYGMAEQMDDAIGRIITALKETGLYDDTMIIFSTDHGELLGDHGLWMKGPFLYEQLVRVPLIVKWPGNMYKGSNGGLVSLTDILPTVIAAAGEVPPDDIDGVDLTPLASGELNGIHNYVTVHHIDDPDKIRVKSVITKERKLTVHYGRPYGELYDLENDPWETKNLWNEPDARGDKADLMELLVNHAERIERRLERICYV